MKYEVHNRKGLYEANILCSLTTEKELIDELREDQIRSSLFIF